MRQIIFCVHSKISVNKNTMNECHWQRCLAPNPKSTTSMTQQHIEMLLDNYDSLRLGESMTLSDSSETKDPQPASKPSNKLVLPPLRYQSLPPCKGPSCGSLDVIEDVNEGSVVCLACGLIQSMYVFESARTDAIFHGGVSRIVAHRYSRIAYLRGILRSLQGNTQTLFVQSNSQRPFEADFAAIEQYFPSEGPRPNGFRVKRAIIALGLPLRLLYHAHSIAFILFKCPTPNPSEQEIRDVLRLFRVLENAWDRLPLGGSIRKGRKKFLSYPVVWKLLCLQLGFIELSVLLPPLKNQRLCRKQHFIFNQLVEYINS